jgi:hypothetical protein
MYSMNSAPDSKPRRSSVSTAVDIGHRPLTWAYSNPSVKQTLASSATQEIPDGASFKEQRGLATADERLLLLRGGAE